MPSSLLSIGDLSRRTGISVSAIRFYEARGLVQAIRTSGASCARTSVAFPLR